MKRNQEHTKPSKRPLPDFQPEDFFVLRSPLLPFDDRPPGPDGDPLADLDRPEIAEALFVASPTLTAGLEKSQDGMDEPRDKGAAKKARRLRESLTRYLSRLRTRSTPFGLFAGSSLGTVGEWTELRLGDRADYRRHTRLDMDYLYRLARDLEQDPAVRPHLTYFPNSSLYRAAGRLRYAEGRHGADFRTYHLVAARDDDFLSAALDAAAGGAGFDDLARAVVALDEDGEIELDEARAFVHELVDAQILVSDLGPRVTGPEPVHDLVERLSGIEKTAPVAARLREVRDALEALDRGDDRAAGALGASPETYRDIARRLGPLGTEVQLPRLFQVDMTKPGDGLRLGPEVVAEVRRAVHFLYRLRGAEPPDAFKAFREDFSRRFEPGRAVPLVELLDEEVGIGFQRPGGVGTEHAPLLQGIPFPRRGGPWEVPWSPAQALVTRKLFEAEGADEVRLTDEDLESLDDSQLKPLPDAFQTFFTVAASSAEAVDRGDFELHLKSASGPSGASLLGRFCHGDPDLAKKVGEHMQREEALFPDALFAEIVHLPEGRTGNVLLRPVLRSHEIPFLGHSGCEPERQIPVTDLRVTVVGEQVVLWSETLRRQIMPRMTTAHNYSRRGLGIYRFLCALQFQGLCAGLTWSWGPLEGLPKLPRVVYGRTVLQPAQWRAEKKELEAWGRKSGKARVEALARWRQDRGLPRRMLLADGDNELYVDFGDPLSVDAFYSIVRTRPSIQLVEPALDESRLALQGPDGVYAHEIVLPFVRKAVKRPRMGAPKRIDFLPKVRPEEVPAHPPGSEWVYAKLYTGSATADELLTGPIRDLLGRYGGQIRRFFFLRYSDPDFHLRARFHLPDPDLRADLQRRLGTLAGELMEEGKIWDLRLDTYRPEIERYGGPHGLGPCERIFDADSRAVVDMLPFLRGDLGAELRWAAALASVDRLLRGVFADGGDARLECLERVKDGFALEFGVDAAMRKRLSTRMREKQALIELALDGGADPASPLGRVLGILEHRAERLADPLRDLRRAEAKGDLTMSLQGVGGSLAHMAVNRLIPAEPRAHEAVLYDFLYRHGISRRARRRAERRRTAETAP